MDKAVDLIKNSNNTLTFNNNIYKESDFTITKLDLNTNKIDEVFVAHDPHANDAVAIAFIIIKDGKVKKYANDWNNLENGMALKDANEFENYSVKKINSYECSNSFDNGLYPECTKVKS